MVIVKNLGWMQEYIQSVEHLLPRIKQLKRISSKQGNKDRWQHCHGLITYADYKSYRITLYVSYHSILDDKIHPYTTMDKLKYLAHELAHLEHWDHTPQHMQLECILLGIFMTKLSQDGYVSEEHEEKNGSFY